MKINSIVVSEFQTNCYVYWNEKTSRGIIIDPGDEADKIFKFISENNINIDYILLTHAHIDHISAVKNIKEITDAKTFLHKDDLTLYKNLKKQGELYGMILDDPPEIDKFIKDGDNIKFEDLTINVIHTPGHSPGSVCFKNEDILFSGDTLFNLGIGRTDLWGGSLTEINKSITEKLFSLDDEIIVYPGHGPKTDIGYEKMNNPFVNSC